MSGFDYFKLGLSKYADFSGRSRRKELWYFFLFFILSAMVAGTIDAALWQFPILYMLTVLGLFIPSLSVTVRRLHDTGRSGWYYFISLVPLVGSILLLVWLCTDGQVGSNKWGANPKEQGSGIHDHLVETHELV